MSNGPKKQMDFIRRWPMTLFSNEAPSPETQNQNATSSAENPAFEMQETGDERLAYRPQTTSVKVNQDSQLVYDESREQARENRSRRGSIQHTEWYKWSQARRASRIRRLNLPNDTATATELCISHFILRARKETAAFGAADEVKETMSHLKQKEDTKARKLRKGRRGKLDEDLIVKKLSLHEWNLMVAYWNHVLYHWLRWIGMASAVLAFLIGIVVIPLPSWSVYTGADNQPMYAGLWWQCSSASGCVRSTLTNDTSVTYHRSVLGLMIVPLVVSLLGFTLLFFALVKSYLPQKLYYFHSAGEVFLVSGLSSTLALILYPVSVTLYLKYSNHSFGYAYGLAWSSASLFLFAYFTLLFDDLMREFARIVPRFRSICCPARANVKGFSDRGKSKDPTNFGQVRA